MPLNEITISGTHRGKVCSVTFTRSNKQWAAEIAIDGEQYHFITSSKPCMVTAERLVEQIIPPIKPVKPRVGLVRRVPGTIKPKLFRGSE